MSFGEVAWNDDSDITLLAQTPPAPRKRNEPDDKEWQQCRNLLEQRLYALRDARLSWLQHWAKLAEAILPRRYHWLISPTTSATGQAINQSIIDPTASQAVRICTAGMRSGLMSSSRPWFKIKAGVRNYQPDRAAQIWFEEVESLIYMIMAGSNFYTAGTQMFEDLIVFGTAPMLIYEDRDDIIRCYVPCAGEYFLGAGSDFRVNSFYRTFKLTVLQCVQMFGLDNVGPELQAQWAEKGANIDNEVIVAHAIEPNFPLGRDGEKTNLGVVPGGFPYREYFWLWGRNTPRPCAVKGYRSQPFITPRWATTSNDPYGRSPGMDALPDILQLHQMTLRQAEAIEKMVRPPMQADVSMKNQPSSILPGRITYVTDLNKGMKPIYEVQPRIMEMSALIEKIEARVQKWFYNDLFLMLDNLEGVQPRNELEISERRGEKLLVLGPVVEQVENELAAGIRRIYAIMGRRGLIPPKPESLQQVPLDIEIMSMIALAQRASETATMERVVAVAAQMSPNFPGQNPLDNIDPDRYIREYADKVSFPSKVFFAEEQVAEKRAQMQKAMEQQQNKADAATALTQTAPAVAKAALDASQIQTGGGLSALDLANGITSPAAPQ
jgi:hypothetical protein